MKGIKKNQKRFLALIIACAMLLTAGTAAWVVKSNANVSDDTVEINILHTNDIHGASDNMAYIAKYKQETKNAILVDGGDATQGKSLAVYTKGDALIQLMNKSGYDLSIFGNHEFDYGQEQLKKNIENAEFTFLSANVKGANGELFAKNKR